MTNDKTIMRPLITVSTAMECLLAPATSDPYNPLFAIENITIARNLNPFLKSIQTILTCYRGPTQTDQTLEGDVRLVFESITGMQEVWGGEDAMVRFYSHACPRLYELETIAYWIIEKLAHSQRLKAQINQIAQVAIDLSIRRGTTSLTILKAENRGTQEIDRPYRYWAKDGGISFETERHGTGQFNLGTRVKALRAKRGMSQSELARLVGVTPSTTSQVEANSMYPSVPALLKIAEVLSIKIGSLF